MDECVTSVVPYAGHVNFDYNKIGNLFVSCANSVSVLIHYC